ncbi:MAG: LysM peptidoglycan-binding domain-containing protein [Coriobacteriaceae bacterium]|nr:LysM peptidoglycan-binding domain-containing protein [Coriobacteriaceae bacterium]
MGASKMNRSSNAMMYRTNGTAALKPQASAFTIHEGTRPVRSQEPEREQLTILQKIECAIIIAAVVAALGLVLSFTDARAAARFEESLSAYPTTTVTVHTGDSLWEIAEDHAPEGMDTATAIRWIEQANGLDSALIMAGQVLIVPAC